MTKEQEVIEYIEKRIKICSENADICDDNDFDEEATYLREESYMLETVLNMLKEKDREIQDLKQELARNIAKNFTSSMKESAKSKDDLEMLNKGWQIELEKKDKIIDLMAEYIATLDIEEDICKNIKNDNCDKMNFGECEYCIKQYFKRKCEE